MAKVVNGGKWASPVVQMPYVVSLEKRTDANHCFLTC